MIVIKRALALLLLLVLSCTSAPEPKTYDVLIRGGRIFDAVANESTGFVGDLAIDGDKIAAIGHLGDARGTTEIDAHGMVVCPGFINMLSWATESLLVDPRALSDVAQGVTLEVFGEGWSMGPLNATMKRGVETGQRDLHFDVPWTTLGEYLEHLEDRGVGVNVASFVGATTLRIHEVGYEDRAPTPEELERMKQLCREAMEDGAMGLGSSLIYAPAFFAKTDELVELAKVAGEYGGMYISHMRSEGNQLVEALDELLHIAREAKCRAEIYHLKAAGEENWPKLEEVIAKVEQARKSGLEITADMYTYTAGATGLSAAMPPWVQEGGYSEWKKRLLDADTRTRVAKEMATPSDKWENLYLMAGGPSHLLLVGFKNADLKPLTGKTLAEVASMRGKSPEETAIDLVVEDGSRVGCVYFLMSEANVRRKLQLPWVSFCSDASAPAPEGAFLKANPHPRAYGSFVRVLGKYSRDARLLSLGQAIHKLSALPAHNLRIKRRGTLEAGNYADVVVFDPGTVHDLATYERPHQLAVGIQHVFVNGTQVLEDGHHTSALPGRVVRGPGWRGYRRPRTETTASNRK